MLECLTLVRHQLPVTQKILSTLTGTKIFQSVGPKLSCCTDMHGEKEVMKKGFLEIWIWANSRDSSWNGRKIITAWDLSEASFPHWSIDSQLELWFLLCSLQFEFLSKHSTGWGFALICYGLAGLGLIVCAGDNL